MTRITKAILENRNQYLIKQNELLTIENEKLKAIISVYKERPEATFMMSIQRMSEAIGQLSTNLKQAVRS